MTIDQIKTFLTVARLGSFRKTSDELFISQPAISSRIQELEKSLDTLLFVRSKQGVLLTKSGLLFKKHATNIMYILEKIKVEVSPASNINFLLRLGVSETIAQSWLSDFLFLIKKTYPNINIELTVDISKHLREQLLNRSIDIAILMGPISEPTIENFHIPEFELSWFKPKDFDNIKLSETPIITYDKGSRPRIELEQALIARVGTDFTIYSSNSISSAFEMVAKGIGIGLLAKDLGQKLIKSGDIEEFTMGWKPKALKFTVSIVSEPSNIIVKDIALLAKNAANSYHKNSTKKPKKHGGK